MALRVAGKLPGRPADMAAQRRRPANRAKLPQHPAALRQAGKLRRLRRLRHKEAAPLHSRRPRRLPLLRPAVVLLHRAPVPRDKLPLPLRAGLPRRVVHRPARMPRRNATACPRTSRWRNPRRSLRILQRAMCRRRRARATKRICPSPTIARRRKPKAVLREQPREERIHLRAGRRLRQRVVAERRQAAP